VTDRNGDPTGSRLGSLDLVPKAREP
jgi:hypothetical protein